MIAKPSCHRLRKPQGKQVCNWSLTFSVSSGDACIAMRIMITWMRGAVPATLLQSPYKVRVRATQSEVPNRISLFRHFGVWSFSD